MEDGDGYEYEGASVGAHAFEVVHVEVHAYEEEVLSLVLKVDLP